MASALPLNVFKTVAANLVFNSGTPTVVYTAPVGVTSIVLMAQVSNVGAADKWVTADHFDGTTATELVKEFLVPTNDAVSVLTGKLVLQTGQSVRMGAETDSFLKVVLSILETSNE